MTTNLIAAIVYYSKEKGTQRFFAYRVDADENGTPVGGFVEGTDQYVPFMQREAHRGMLMSLNFMEVHPDTPREERLAMAKEFLDRDITYGARYSTLGSEEEITAEVEEDVNHFFVTKDRAESIRQAAEMVINNKFGGKQ